MNNIISSKVATVKLGTLEIEGLLFEDGRFGVAFPQLERLNLVPPNRSIKQLEALLGIVFPSHVKTKNELNSKAVNAIDLCDFERVLRTLDRKKASELCLERNCNRDTLRDTHDELTLARIDKIEAVAMIQIDSGMEPIEAMCYTLETVFKIAC
jgi:hypothetical protein